MKNFYTLHGNISKVRMEFIEFSREIIYLLFLIAPYSAMSSALEELKIFIPQAIKANTENTVPLYLDAIYEITYGNFGGDAQKELYGKSVPFETKTKIKLRSYGPKYWFRKVTTRDAKVIENYEVTYDGNKTREVHYKKTENISEALDQKEPSLDVTIKGRGAILTRDKLPWGFLSIHAGCQEELAEFLTKAFSKNDKIIPQWVTLQDGKKHLSVDIGNSNSLVKKIFTLDPEQSFLPNHITINTNNLIGDVSITYKAFSVNGVHFFYPKEIVINAFYSKNNEKKQVVGATLVFQKVDFSQDPPKDAFSLAIIPEEPEE